ncbi:MAG: superoxide dismutase family protein, partial [Xanthomonadaceae bacterium]|nr:superoxide dismutase family protein [Xanthomonadaceae bacterium]
MTHHQMFKRPAARMLAGLFVLANITVAMADDHQVNVAMATISGCADLEVNGAAMLQETASSEGIKQVEIYMRVSGLSDGKHAVHIHETAKCEPCSAAGGHHDPGLHGKTTPDAPDFNHPFHMGDLINIDVKDGIGEMRTVTNRITLSAGRLSIFDDDGSAFIIHTETDQYCDHEDELEAGCAGGARDACGI